jgi:hypothetical protein
MPKFAIGINNGGDFGFWILRLRNAKGKAIANSTSFGFWILDYTPNLWHRIGSHVAPTFLYGLDTMIRVERVAHTINL